jgi:hypothetical protein
LYQREREVKAIMLYSGYQEQLQRVKRWLGRIQDQHLDSETHLDFMWAYFQNCWVLKDWIKNDSNVPKGVRDKIEGELKNHKNLMICADLANRSKHLTLLDKRVGGKVDSIGVTVHVPTIGSKTPVRSEHHYTVVGDAGELGDGIQIAQDAYEEWLEVLRKLNLKE